MISLGLTGNIGCGKSTVARMFRDLGAELIDADAIVHGLLREGPVAERVAREFPAAARGAAGSNASGSTDGLIDRRALGRLVFADAERRRALEEILHPEVIAETRRRLRDAEARGVALAVTEVPLLYEHVDRTGDSSSLDRFDAIVVVRCDPERQWERLVDRHRPQDSDGDWEAELRGRLAAQIDQAEKARRADHVIDNSGPLPETERQVRMVHSRLADAGADGR